MRITFWHALLLVFALPSLLDLGTGCDRVFGLQRFDQSDLPDENAQTCRCTCFAGTGDELGRDFDVCLPPALNPNLPDGTAATGADLQADCSGRVRTTFLTILDTCATARIKKKLQQEGDAACACDSFMTKRFVDACNGDCTSVPLAADCSNQNDATSVPGQEPLCLAEPSTSARVALGQALFGGRSTCDVSGTVSVSRGDDHQTQDAHGAVEFTGGPCPGGSCNVAMAYRLDHVDDFGFSSFAGFASTAMKGIQTSGATLSAATLDAFGNGAFGAGAAASSARGTRVDEEIFGTISDETTTSYTASNGDPVAIGVDWAGHACALSGALIGSVEDSDTDVTVAMEGTILNEPPTARAGTNRTVECAGPGGAPVTLTAAASTDPESNIRFRAWRNGGPAGTEIDDPENDGAVTVAQALGTTRTYALNVVDAFMDVSQASTQVSVVDSTPPTITAASVSPTTLSPPNHKMRPVVVSVSAEDTCGTASCSIVSIASNEALNGKGDGNTDVDYEITGALTANLRAERAGNGNGRIYTVTVRCADPTGNGSTRTVQVSVPK